MKIIEEVLEVTLTAGQTTQPETIPLPDGDCFRVVAEPIDGTVTKNVNIGILDSGGSDIVKAHTHSLWAQRAGGDYYESMKPANFFCGRNVKAVLTAPVALANDVTFQFIFFIKEKAD